MHFSSTSCTTHALLISFICISTPQYWVTVTNYESGWEMKQPYWTILITKAFRTIQIKNPVTAVVLSKDELPP